MVFINIYVEKIGIIKDVEEWWKIWYNNMMKYFVVTKYEIMGNAHYEISSAAGYEMFKSFDLNINEQYGEQSSPLSYINICFANIS